MQISQEQYGELKTLISQVGETVGRLEARFDAKDHLGESAEFFRAYKFEVTIRREAGMYVAESKANWTKNPVNKCIETTPLLALKKLVMEFEATQVFHKPGAIS